MAAQGERVMVVARRDFDPATFDPDAPHLDDIRDLTLLAMVGIVDPPRAEAKVAIEQCHRAGIEVRMITGDHAVTAAAIGHELGITGKALTGRRVRRDERRPADRRTRRHRRRRPRVAGGQDPPGQHARRGSPTSSP